MKFLFFIIICFCFSCSTFRLINYSIPGSGDQYIFPCINFPASPTPINIPVSYRPPHFSQQFRKFLHSHHTLAFLMIQDDTVRLEYYAPHISPNQCLDLFSISKSVVASVLAIAYQEGYFSSLSDTLGKYLKNLPPQYAGIPIADLLNMRCGIHKSIYYTTRLYYSTNLPRTLSHTLVGTLN